MAFLNMGEMALPCECGVRGTIRIISRWSPDEPFCFVGRALWFSVFNEGRVLRASQQQAVPSCVWGSFNMEIPSMSGSKLVLYNQVTFLMNLGIFCRVKTWHEEHTINWSLVLLECTLQTCLNKNTGVRKPLTYCSLGSLVTQSDNRNV